MTPRVFARKKITCFTLAVRGRVFAYDFVAKSYVAKSYVLYFISAGAVVQLRQPHAGFVKL